MLETMKYVRKPFEIDAVRVTEANFDDVASWASGEIRVDGDGKTPGKRHIKVRVHRPLNERQTKAYVGDWVLYAGTGFKVYTDKAFKASFEQSSVETTMHQTGADAPNAASRVEVTETVFVQETAKPAKKATKTAVQRTPSVVEPSPVPAPSA